MSCICVVFFSKVFCFLCLLDVFRLYMQKLKNIMRKLKEKQEKQKETKDFREKQTKNKKRNSSSSRNLKDIYSRSSGGLEDVLYVCLLFVLSKVVCCSCVLLFLPSIFQVFAGTQHTTLH